MKIQKTQYQPSFKAIHIKGDLPLDTYINLQDAAKMLYILEGKKPTDHFIRTSEGSETEKELLKKFRELAPDLKFFSIMDDLVEGLAKSVSHRQRNKNVRVDFKK